MERQPPAPCPVPGDSCEALVHALPQPLHLFVALSGGFHYHFGEFGAAGEPLLLAQDRLSRRAADDLPRAGAVLDVGCGLGGTAALLGRMGFAVTAIDPCVEAIRFASRVHQDGRGLRFLNQSLESFAALPRRTGFEAVVLIEVLKHVPDLDLLWRICGDLVVPGGVVSVCDVFSNVVRPLAAGTFHRLERVRGSAEAFGFRPLRSETISRQVVPTLDRLLADLAMQRGRLVDRFGSSRPRLEEEIRELSEQCKNLRRAFSSGDLGCERLAWRFARSGQDRVLARRPGTFLESADLASC